LGPSNVLAAQNDLDSAWLGLHPAQFLRAVPDNARAGGSVHRLEIIDHPGWVPMIGRPWSLPTGSRRATRASAIPRSLLTWPSSRNFCPVSLFSAKERGAGPVMARGKFSGPDQLRLVSCRTAPNGIGRLPLTPCAGGNARAR